MTNIFELSDRLIEYGISRVQIARMAGRSLGQSKAKKAISSMLRQGISFSRIEIDNMNFLINETGEIRRCFGLYKELDEFPRGSGPPPTWPDQN